MNSRIPRLYVLTSDGRNDYPATCVTTAVCLDENVHQRLDSASTEDFKKLRAWLEKVRLAPGYAVMASVALEHVVSSYKTKVDRVPLKLRKISHAITGESTLPLSVDGDDSIFGVIASLAIRTLVGCAEIGWVRRAYLDGNRTASKAETNIRSFLEWRRTRFPHFAQATSTLLCVAALGGNASAAAALKALKKNADWLRNGAFDSVHLDYFCDACSPARRWSAGSSVAVFITGDQGLAHAFDTVKSGWVGPHGVALIRLQFPWIRNKTKLAAVRKAFLDWRPSASPPRTSTEAAAILAVREVCGSVPPKVQQLYMKTQEYRLRHRKDMA